MIKQIPITNDQLPVTSRSEHRVINTCLVLCAWSLVLCLAGCGGPEHPPVGRVTGAITLDGQPLPDATVMFQPPDGRPAQGTTDKSGKYSLTYLDGVPGAKVGTNTVIIRTEIPGEDGKPPIAKEKLPKKYHAESELRAEVKAGSNTFNFDLTSKGGGKK